jgi:type I restriction enzyme S subunit
LLGDLADVLRGVTYKKEVATESSRQGFLPLLRANNIDGELNFENLVYVPEGLINEVQMVKKNDLVIAMSSGSANLVGKAAQAKKDFHGSFGAFCGVVRPKRIELAAYLAFFFQTPLYRETTAGQGKGIGINNIGKKQLDSICVPLPPLAEQHRIVAKVDQLMALCDELEVRQRKQQEGQVRLNSAALDALLNAGGPADFASHWQRICANFDLLYDHPDTIAKLRAAILQLAVQGKLVPQDPGDEPAEGLKSKKPVRTTEGDVPFNVPSSWVWKPLGELTSLITSGSRGWKEFYAESGATFIRSQDIKFDRLEYDQRAFVSLPERTEGLRTRVTNGDLLVTITGANVAKAALIEEDPGEAYVSQHVALIRLDKVEYGPYVHKWLIGECGGRRLLLESSYGAKPGLNLQNLRDLLVPLPPLAEQCRIVAKVDQLMALCDALEAKLNQARQKSEKLMEASVRELLVA